MILFLRRICTLFSKQLTELALLRFYLIVSAVKKLFLKFHLEKIVLTDKPAQKLAAVQKNAKSLFGKLQLKQVTTKSRSININLN